MQSSLEGIVSLVLEVVSWGSLLVLLASIGFLFVAKAAPRGNGGRLRECPRYEAKARVESSHDSLRHLHSTDDRCLD